MAGGRLGRRTPRPGATDRLVYAALAGTSEQARAAGMSGVEAWMGASRVENLFMDTRAAMEERGPEGNEAGVVGLATSYARAGWALEDYSAQAGALGRHDVSAALGGDMAHAARAVRARLLVVYTPDDRMVSAGPAAEFAEMVPAETLAISSTCGHSVFWCEDDTLGAAVRDFIDGAPRALGSR